MTGTRHNTTQFLQYSGWNPGFYVSMKDLAQWGPSCITFSSHPITSVPWVAGARGFIWLQRQRQECQDRRPACQWPPPPGEKRGKNQFLALSTGTVTHVTLTLPRALQSQFLVCCTERGNHLCFRHLLCVTVSGASEAHGAASTKQKEDMIFTVAVPFSILNCIYQCVLSL